MRVIVRNSIFMTLFNLFGRASGFIRYYLLVSYLSAPEFALITFGLKFGSIARTFIDGGLDNLIARDCARDPSTLPGDHWNGLILKTMLSVVFFLGAYVYLRPIRDLATYEILIVYLSLLGSFFISLSGVTRSCFTAIERMEYVLYTNLPARFISISLLFVVLWFGFPLAYAATAISFEFVLWFILLFGISLRFFPIAKRRASLSRMFYMVSESWSLALYGFFNVFYLGLDVIMIEFIMGDPVYVAPYTYASMLVEGVTMLLTGYIIAIYPALSRYYQSDQVAYHRLFSQSVVIILSITVPISVVLFFWSHGWMNFIRETGPIPGEVLRVLAVNLNLSMLNTLVIIVFTSRNRQRWLVLFTGMAVAVSFISNWIMIEWYEQLGAAWATLFSQLTLFTVMAGVAVRMFGIRFPWRRPFWVLVISILAGGLTWMIPSLPLWAVPVIYGALLSLFAWSFGVITPEEIQNWKRELKKE